MFSIFLPVYGFLFLAAATAFAGKASDFLARTARLYWGTMNMRHKIGVAMALWTALVAACGTREQPAQIIEPGYPELTDGKIIQGARHELANILTQWDAQIYFMPARREFVVAGLGYNYRYSEAGELRDVQEHSTEAEQRIHRAGLTDSLYCTTDVAALSHWAADTALDDSDDAALDVAAWFNEADDFEVVLDPTVQRAYALVRRGDRKRHRVSRTIYAWLIAQNKIHETYNPIVKPTTTLLHCQRAIQLDFLEWRSSDRASPLHIDKYQREVPHRPKRSWFDFGFSFGHGGGQWRPAYHGPADVRLQHQGDALRFRITIGEDPSATFRETLYPWMYRLEVPESLRGPDSAVFIVLAYNDDRPRREKGLYIVRRQGLVADATTRARYFTERPLSFALRGLQPMAGEWSGVRYFNGRREDFARGDLTETVAAKPRSLPSELHFFWQAPKLGEYETWDVATADGSLDGHDELTVRLVFDRQALLAAIARFAPDAALELGIDAHHYKQAVWLSVTLSDGNKRVLLPKTRMGSHDHPMSEGSSGTESFVSRQHFEHLLQLATSRADAETSEALLVHLADMPEHALRFDAIDYALGMERFVNVQKHAGRDDVVRAAFALFLQKIHPHLPPNARVLQQLAVNMLAVHDLDKALYEQIWSQLLRGDEQAASFSEPKLLFNLACYEARVGNKPGMLHFAERALQLGTQPASFRVDRDFDSYKTDTDFEGLLLRYGSKQEH